VVRGIGGTVVRGTGGTVVRELPYVRWDRSTYVPLYNTSYAIAAA
jgi:hypothetical protein